MIGDGFSLALIFAAVVVKYHQFCSPFPSLRLFVLVHIFHRLAGVFFLIHFYIAMMQFGVYMHSQ